LTAISVRVSHTGSEDIQKRERLMLLLERCSTGNKCSSTVNRGSHWAGTRNSL